MHIFFLAKCPDACNLNYLPVCGSDGITYGNDCALRYVTCRRNILLRKRHDGPCLGKEII